MDYSALCVLVPCVYLCPVGTCALWVLVPCGYLCPVGIVPCFALPLFISEDTSEIDGPGINLLHIIPLNDEFISHKIHQSS